LRACPRRQEGAKLFGDRVEIRVGDLAGSSTDLTGLFQGCDALFLVNTGPGLGERDRACALAASGAGVQYLVKLSALDVKTGVGTGPWHARGEEARAPYTKADIEVSDDKVRDWPKTVPFSRRDVVISALFTVMSNDAAAAASDTPEALHTLLACGSNPNSARRRLRKHTLQQLWKNNGGLDQRHSFLE
jgi:hypothetical protein